MDQPATEPVTKESPPAATEADAECRWPIVAAFITVWLLPATTARRLAHVSLLRAWLFHAAVIVLATALIVFLVAWSEVKWNRDLPVVMHRFWREVGGFVNQFNRNPTAFPATVAGVWLAIEVVLLVLALVVMPWGAGDEPLGRSYRNAVRQVWLQCAHVIVCVLLAGLTGLVTREMAEVWEREKPGLVLPKPPAQPKLSRDDPSYEEVMSEYRSAIKRQNDEAIQAWRDWERYRNPKPGYVQYPELLITHSVFAAAVWLFWGLLRGVGARRNMPRVVRPPTCEFCGYNLTGMPLDRRCPECGEPVVASLGPDVRPGAPWERRRQIGRWAGWWQSCCGVTQQSTTFGRCLRVTPKGIDHRRFLAVNLPVIYFTGAVCLVGTVSAVGGTREFAAQPMLAAAVMSMVGCACVVGAVIFTLVAVALVGMIESLHHKRNLLPGAMQVGCYLGAYLTVWVLFAGVVGVGLLVLLPKTHLFRGSTNLLDILWLAPNAIIMWLAYFGLLARATTAMRYANR